MPDSSCMNKIHSKTFIISQITKPGNICTSCLPPNYIFFRVFHEQTHIFTTAFSTFTEFPLLLITVFKMRKALTFNINLLPCRRCWERWGRGLAQGTGPSPRSPLTTPGQAWGPPQPGPWKLIRARTCHVGHNATLSPTLPRRPATLPPLLRPKGCGRVGFDLPRVQAGVPLLFTTELDAV